MKIKNTGNKKDRKFSAGRIAGIGLAVFVSLAVSFALSIKAQGAGIQSGSQNQKDSNNPESLWPHQDTDLDPCPEIIFGKTDNGVRYVLKQNEKPENRVAMHLNVQAGSYHESEEERGIAHFLEHMLFLGTKHFEPGELVKFFQRIGMKFGPDVNARTGFFHTIYDIDLPEGDKDSLSEGLLVLRDYAAGGLIPEEQVDSERSVILAEKRTRDSPSYRTFKETLAFEMPDTRVTRRLPIGTAEVIKKADRERIKTFYDSWYRPENMIVVMVGDFDTENGKAVIEQKFSDIAPRSPEKPDPDFVDFKHRGVKPFYHYEPESGSTRAKIEVIERKDQPKDSFSYRENRLLEQMANSIVNYRLEEILNAGDAPFTSANTGSGYYFGHVRAAEISAQGAPEKWEESLDVLEKTIRKALTHGFTETETNRVKREFIAQLERSARAAPTMESKSISRRFLNDLNRDRVLLLAECRLNLFMPVVNSATPDKLHNALKNAWSPDHRLVLVTGNAKIESEEKSPEEIIREVYEESKTQKVQKPAKSEDVTFPYLQAPEKPGAVKSEVHIEDLGITRVLFENGATLFVKKTDFKEDEVLASLRFGEGRRSEPKNKDGLADLSQRVVNLGGLGAMDKEQLRGALAGTDTSISFSVEEDAFSFSGQSVPGEARLLFELLYAHIKDPAYRESAYTRAVSQFERRYESLAHSIEGGLQLKGRRFLAGGDTRFGLPEFETLAGNELTDIANWIENAKNSSPVEIAVVGNIDSEKIIKLAAKFIGSLPPASGIENDTEKTRTHTTRNDRAPAFPEGQRLEHAVPTRMQRALLMVSYPTTDIFNIETTRRLSILSDIFSDRMRIRIRDELGAVYSQTAFNSPSRAYSGYGFFGTYTIIDPEDAKAIEKEIKNIAKDLRKNPIEEDELKRAVNPVLSGITNRLKTNGYWLNTVIKGASRHPAQLDWSRTIHLDYASINVKDINKTAKKYLDNETAATMLFHPENKDVR